MTQVSSLELSKRLHEVSGWESGKWLHTTDTTPTGLIQPRRIPEYDSDFLLEKLPYQTKVFQATENIYGAYIEGVFEKYVVYADTPSDALCKLAIALFESGVLERGRV